MDLIDIRRILMTFGGKDMKLINQHTITQEYSTTLAPLYTNEIEPFITFGDYTKLIVCIFENNTSTLANKIDCVFFSLAVAPGSMTSSTQNGGMVRGGYTNIRKFDRTNDARCSIGTIIKIYEINI